MELPAGIKSTQELVDAQAHAWNHIFKFIDSMSLKCAVELGIADMMSNHGKPMTLSELTIALSINAAKSLCVHRLMRILVHSKFFTIIKNSDEAECYWLTPASRLLIKHEPLNVTPFLLDSLHPFRTDVWHHMSQWFKTDHPSAFVTVHGRTLWEVTGQDPTLNQSFNESLASDTRLIATVIVKDCAQVFEGLTSMVDVAGGDGTAAKAIADAFPGLICTVFDLPHVVAGLEGTNNLKFIGGDMFEFIPPADAVFLKNVIHDWPDEECVTILKKCKQVIPSKDKGGKVIIVDIIVNEEKDDKQSMETKLYFDVLMMVDISGRERTIQDWAKLFNEAGFTSYKITPLLGVRSLIEVFP